WLETTIASALPDDADPSMICVVSNPEFLREGAAVHDFLHPDRVVIGGDCEASVEKVACIYLPILEQTFEGGTPNQLPSLLTTGRTTAETIKYAANAFLATKISFINEIARICEGLGADVTEVAEAIGLDSRIGPAFLDAGVGWGGSCFGKDTAALASMARDRGIDPLILDAVREVNARQRDAVVTKLERHLNGIDGKRIAVLGLAFKPGTDDLRDAPAVTIAGSLLEQGAVVRACDPMVDHVPSLPDLEVFADPFEAIRDADAALLITEWPELISLDFVKVAERMSGSTIIDGRNALDPAEVVGAGLVYEGVGRSTHSL
ncbi:MAG: UDP-glucose dehydrogenase family protein, partial [Acidimicrobiia bacterium]